MAAADLSAERADIQGLVASGYGHLPHAAYLLFAIDEPVAAGDWLGRLADTVTTARRWVEQQALGVALTATGLRAIGLSDRVRLRSGPRAQAIQTGEFLLGYPNEYDQYTDRPLIHPREDQGGLVPDDAAGSGLRPARLQHV